MWGTIFVYLTYEGAAPGRFRCMLPVQLFWATKSWFWDFSHTVNNLPTRLGLFQLSSKYESGWLRYSWCNFVISFVLLFRVIATFWTSCACDVQSMTLDTTSLGVAICIYKDTRDWNTTPQTQKLLRFYVVQGCMIFLLLAVPCIVYNRNVQLAAGCFLSPNSLQ